MNYVDNDLAMAIALSQTSGPTNDADGDLELVIAMSRMPAVPSVMPAVPSVDEEMQLAMAMSLSAAQPNPTTTAVSTAAASVLAPHHSHASASASATKSTPVGTTMSASSSASSSMSVGSTTSTKAVGSLSRAHMPVGSNGVSSASSSGSISSAPQTHDPFSVVIPYNPHKPMANPAGGTSYQIPGWAWITEEQQSAVQNTWSQLLGSFTIKERNELVPLFRKAQEDCKKGMAGRFTEEDLPLADKFRTTTWNWISKRNPSENLVSLYECVVGLYDYVQVRLTEQLPSQDALKLVADRAHFINTPHLNPSGLNREYFDRARGAVDQIRIDFARQFLENQRTFQIYQNGKLIGTIVIDQKQCVAHLRQKIRKELGKQIPEHFKLEGVKGQLGDRIQQSFPQLKMGESSPIQVSPKAPAPKKEEAQLDAALEQSIIDAFTASEKQALQKQMVGVATPSANNGASASASSTATAPAKGHPMHQQSQHSASTSAAQGPVKK